MAGKGNFPDPLDKNCLIVRDAVPKLSEDARTSSRVRNLIAEGRIPKICCSDIKDEGALASMLGLVLSTDRERLGGRFTSEFYCCTRKNKVTNSYFLLGFGKPIVDFLQINFGFLKLRFEFAGFPN
ncbi:hypothetical protein CFP56_026759 [Quercus suber]|uniref:Uncharacterized protein n=1 Tax=Quercus suber TaxID=58331 RepID=A0AAW0K0K1_QUESU